MISSLPNRKGYTLIEIIVVMAVTSILAGVGLFSLNTINRRQNLVQNTKKIVSEIRLAKSLADSQQKDQGSVCDRLNGYKVEIGSNTITITGVCESNTFVYNTTTYTATISGLTEIFFPVLHQPVVFTPPGSNQVTVTQNSQSITFSIETTGVINYD